MLQSLGCINNAMINGIVNEVISELIINYCSSVKSTLYILPTCQLLMYLVAPIQ